MEFLLQPLTLVTFFPLLGVLVLLFLPSENKNLLRWTAMVTSRFGCWVCSTLPTRTCNWLPNIIGSQ